MFVNDGRILYQVGFLSYCWKVFISCSNDFGFISAVFTWLLILTRFESLNLWLVPLIIMLYNRSVKKYNSSTRLITDPPKHRPKIPPNEAAWTKNIWFVQIETRHFCWTISIYRIIHPKSYTCHVDIWCMLNLWNAPWVLLNHPNLRCYHCMLDMNGRTLLNFFTQYFNVNAPLPGRCCIQLVFFISSR